MVDSARPEDGLPLPIAGDTRLYVIIGDPIVQAGSPMLFNAAFRALGQRAVLVPLQVAPARLDDLLGGLRGAGNLGGIVVTVPHKLAVLEHLDEVGASGRRVGAVNAIRCEPDGRWVGDNFDGAGCVRGLLAAGHRLEGCRVQLIGAGGAGRAVAHAFAEAGIASLAVADVATERARSLVDSLAAAHPALAVSTGLAPAPNTDVVMNCTPLGMRPDDPYPLDPERVVPGTLVVDAILKPARSPLLEACAVRGCVVQPGRPMLEGQVAEILDFFGLGRAS